MMLVKPLTFIIYTIKSKIKIYIDPNKIDIITIIMDKIQLINISKD